MSEYIVTPSSKWQRLDRPGWRLNWRYSPHPGFGVVEVYSDAVLRWSSVHEKGLLAVLREWRDVADAEPERTWQIAVEAPMGSVLYTRKTRRDWLATHRHRGFA